MRRRIIRLILLGVMTGCPAALIHAEYYVGQLEEVPIDRLIGNLERKLREEPESAHAYYLLARVHSMAFATGQSTFRVQHGTEIPSFDDGASGVYLPPRSIDLPELSEEKNHREAHLKSAVDLFARASELDPSNLPSRVGLGWSLMKANREREALKVLRPAFEEAWTREKREKGGEMGRSLTVELGSYLLDLLDPQDDAREINRVQRRVRTIEQKPRWITPILVPLGDNIAFSDLVTRGPSVEFDLDGDGTPQRWEWITPEAAWLVYDSGEKNVITSGRELVGATTFWVFWSNGYEALAALDDNDDGTLRSEELDGLALWQDANSNGISEQGEVQSLLSWGIVELACTGSRINDTLLENPQGVRFTDGACRPTYDWSPMGIPIQKDP